jgi:hypothetical protein
MSKNNKIIYTGMELTSDKTVRSQIKTLNPYYVLADMLLKAKKPYGIKPNRNVVLRTTESNVKLGDLPIKDDRYMSIIMNTSYVDTGEEHSAYGIITTYSDESFEIDEETKYSKNTSQFYQCPSYDASLKDLKEKIENWTNGNLLAAKILVAMASSSPDHCFWKSTVPIDKKSKYSFQNRWNSTDWSGWG